MCGLVCVVACLNCVLFSPLFCCVFEFFQLVCVPFWCFCVLPAGYTGSSQQLAWQQLPGKNWGAARLWGVCVFLAWHYFFCLPDKWLTTKRNTQHGETTQATSIKKKAKAITQTAHTQEYNKKHNKAPKPSIQQTHIFKFL